MTFWTALKEPLQGRTSLARVFWGYGLLGSVLVSALELFINPQNGILVEIYTLFGVLYSAYVTVATYKCADNCGSPALARFVRVSTVVSVIVIVPLCAYLYFTGALNVATTFTGE